MLPAAMWLALFTLIQSTNSHRHHKIHNHDRHHANIIKGVNLHRTWVNYKNHPYEGILDNDTSSNSRRSLLTEAETAPIRVSAHYDEATILNSRTSDQINSIKAVIGAIVNYYEKAIRVVPVEGTFYLQRVCRASMSAQKPGYERNCIEYRGSPGNYLKCIDAVVPDEHLSESWLYNYPVNEGVTILPGGPGIADTDLMLYVTANETADCSGSTLAYAGPCAYDQYGRPIAGGINICENFFTDDEWKTDVQTMLHEMTHITIMIDSLWDEFRNATGGIIPEEDVYDTTVSPPVLKSPILLETVRDHFNCPTANGYPVQTSSTSHWHMRYSFSENMNPSTWTGQTFYSKFTLALMEDSGWYLPNYEYADPFFFGQDAGCSFLPNIEGVTQEICDDGNFPQWYCDFSGVDDYGCNQDYSAPGSCDSDSDLTDGCYVRDPFTTSSVANDFESVCVDVRGNNGNLFAYGSEVFNSSSRCANIKQTDGEECDYSTGCGGFCFKHNCYNYDDEALQYDVVDIIVNSDGQTITCTRDMQLTTVALADGLREIECPVIDIVCGTQPNFGSCYWGHYEEDANDGAGGCVCTAGYTGDDCNTIDDSTDVEAVLAPSVSTVDSPLCVRIGNLDTTYGDYNGDYEYVTDSEHDWGYPAYLNPNTGKYVYWNSYRHVWYIADSLREKAQHIRAECDVSEFTANISECNGNWQLCIKPGACGNWHQSGNWVTDTSSISEFWQCTDEPTTTPTQSPVIPAPTLSPSTAAPTPMIASPTTAAPTTNNPTTNGPTTASPTTSNPSASPTSPIRSDDLVEIFCDNMTSLSSNWSTSQTPPVHIEEVINGYFCSDPDVRCIGIKGFDNQENWIRTSVSNNYSIYALQFDVTLSALESDDYCRIKYSFDGITFIQLASYQGNETTLKLLDQEFMFNYESSSDVYIQLETDGDSSTGSDICYYDNVCLLGQGSVTVTTASPITPAPVTPLPTTPSPITPAPVTPAPTTPAPVTPAPTTSTPTTASPTTSAPTTPSPTTPPITPAPTTASPTTPAPTTPSPTTLSPTTQMPTTASPSTSVPTTAEPTIPSVSPTAAPITTTTTSATSTTSTASNVTNATVMATTSTTEEAEQCPGLDLGVALWYRFNFNDIQRTCEVCLFEEVFPTRRGRRGRIQIGCERIEDFINGVVDEFSDCMLNVCNYDCSLDRLQLTENADQEVFCGCNIFECGPLGANKAYNGKLYNVFLIIALSVLLNSFCM